MVRGGVCAAALALLLVCLGLISNAEAGRTHELFAQSTYEDPGSSIDEKPTALVAEPRKDVDNNLPVKTPTSTSTTAQDSTNSQPQEADTSTGTTQNPESAAAQSATPFVAMPQQQKHQQPQQRYTDHRGTTTTPQGDYKPDPRPWWFNPQYDTYGNYVQGPGKTQLDQQQPNPTDPTAIPNRYPMGYPTQYMGTHMTYSNPASGTQSYSANNGQYSSSMQQQQQQQQYYSQNQYGHYSSNAAYETTAGGCPTQYWISNTQRWPAFFTVKTIVGDALGSPATKIFGQTTLLQALLNARPDGYSTLLRSAATAILNSYSRSEYKFSHLNVIESFAASLSSSKGAAEQAAAFEEANISAYAQQYNTCL